MTPLLFKLVQFRAWFSPDKFTVHAAQPFETDIWNVHGKANHSEARATLVVLCI